MVEFVAYVYIYGKLVVKFHVDITRRTSIRRSKIVFIAKSLITLNVDLYRVTNSGSADVGTVPGESERHLHGSDSKLCRRNEVAARVEAQREDGERDAGHYSDCTSRQNQSPPDTRHDQT